MPAQLQRILMKLRYRSFTTRTVPGARVQEEEEDEEEGARRGGRRGGGEEEEAGKEENEKGTTAVVSCEMAIPLDRNHP